MRILQVNTADQGGGAESSARYLCQAFRERGHESWLAVGRKRTTAENVREIARLPVESPVGRALQGLQRLVHRVDTRVTPLRRVARWLGVLADPRRRHNGWLGYEDFEFPGTRRLLDLFPSRPDVVHCHNLHGWYFDLRYLPELSHQVPVILNLRDAWLLTGHCAHFFDCQRWQTGCGNCPDLSIYPAVRRDETARNWQCKSDIYAKSRLFLTSPSKWLLDCTRASTLRGVDYRVIPNGIDLRVFKPGDRRQARAQLGLPPDAAILLFSMASGRQNVFKDLETLGRAMDLLASRRTVSNLLLVCLGGAAGPRLRVSQAAVRFAGYQSAPRTVAAYYQAADVYVHSARAETFPRVITEAMACATPVVATAVGGIPELVQEGETGFLTAPGDAQAMAARAETLLADSGLHARFAARAAVVGAQYGLDRQVDAFLAWYAEIAERCREHT